MIVDLCFLEKFTKGDTKKMQRYINLYLDVAPKTFAQMQQNLKDKDWEQLRIHAHSLKPQAEFMGIQELKNALIAIEDSIKSNKCENCEALYNSAFEIHKTSEVILKQKLESI
ncbi:Hpt domain-containing protein [Hanstruepera marina]|uniref:Hpt domain-containing protein n=1 Tax=Hanstruepera marina TaxID=2873265 RepID=UPI001CA617A9|nr:Hpt domain-containing protein [Hanstruepera marina]